MFCPKCGLQTVEAVRFCRQCGTDLGAVNEALTGELSVTEKVSPTKKEKNVENLISEGIKQVFAGVAFLIIAMILATTNIIGGKVWWFWLLIPALGAIGSGIAAFVRVKMLKDRQTTERRQSSVQAADKINLNNAQTPFFTPNASPIEARESFGSYRTDELAVPPSVTEHTTRHLDLASENETQHLPKNDRT